MFEHVGFRNYRRFFEVSRRCLDDDGLSLLHCIGSNKSVTHTDPWIAKYIFPNSMLPSAAQIATGTEGRSEEHTSELQSLMRLSYAVFCLNKKITLTHTNH